MDKTDLTKLPPPPKDQQGFSLDELKKLPPPPSGQKGMTLDEINNPQPKDRLQAYIDSQSSQGAEANKRAEGNQSVLGQGFSGAPFLPANKSDTSQNGGGFNPFKTAGKIVANTVSDLPSIVKGAADMVIHPIDAVSGMAKYYAGIAGETFGALKDAVMKGDTSRLMEDIDKATVQMVDHPLQTIAAFEGAKGIGEFAANPVKGATGIADATTKALDNAKVRFENAKQSFKGQGLTFATDSALHKKTVEVGSTIRNVVDSEKKVADLQKELDSMSEKQKSALKGKEGEIAQKTTEQIQKELELQNAKNELVDLAQMQKKQVADAAKLTQQEAKQNGFPSEKDMKESIDKTKEFIKDKSEKSYEENLGNAKVDFSGFFPAITKVLDELKNNSMIKDVGALKPVVDNIQMRDMVTKFAGDEKGFFNEMAKQGIEPEFSSLEEYKKEFPPIDSSNFKGTVGAIRGFLKENNPYAFKLYDKYVTPVLKDSFRTAIKDQYGDTVLGKIDETDKMYTELKSNPLFDKKNPSLSDVNDNWKSFSKNAEQLPEGKAMVDRLKNYTLDQILEKARNPDGTYKTSTINTEMKKYPNIIEGDVKNKLQGIIDLNNTLTEKAVSAKQVIEQKKGEVADTKENIQKLQDDQKQIKTDMKKVGETPDAVIKNIKGIKSTAELNTFLEKTGTTIENLRKVTIQSIIERVDPRLLEDKNVPFDVNKTGELIKELV